MIRCDHDCLNCPYPDVPEECLSAPLTYAEYRELRRIDSELINPKTAAQKKAAARGKARYEANKEKEIAYQNAYREANKEKLAPRQKCISEARKARHMTQADLAIMIGISRGAIAMWECGYAPANWDKLCAVLPELEEYRP